MMMNNPAPGATKAGNNGAVDSSGNPNNNTGNVVYYYSVPVQQQQPQQPVYYDQQQRGVEYGMNMAGLSIESIGMADVLPILLTALVGLATWALKRRINRLDEIEDKVDANREEIHKRLNKEVLEASRLYATNADLDKVSHEIDTIMTHLLDKRRKARTSATSSKKYSD